MCIIIYLISLLNSLMSVGYIRCNILICLFDLYSTGRGAPILVHDWYLCVRLSVWVLKYMSERGKCSLPLDSSL